jgi:hypothetical protein
MDRQKDTLNGYLFDWLIYHLTIRPYMALT